MKMTMRAARLGSFSQGIGAGAMPTAVSRLRTASVRKCGRNACSPTETRSSGQALRITAYSRFGSGTAPVSTSRAARRSEEHTSELQSLAYLVCRLLLEKKKKKKKILECK